MARTLQNRRRIARRLGVEALEPRCVLSSTQAAAPAWAGYAHDAQHTAISSVASQSLETIAWQTPVDEAPQFSGNDLLIHYGSPLITAANTVIVPVKTGATGGFELRGIDAVTGSLKWTQATDYLLPPHDWVPGFSPALAPTKRLYFAGAGGTINYIDAPDATGAVTSGRLAFFGLASYTANQAALDGSVFINTPITVDGEGNLYFGFQVTGANPANLQSGIARIDAAGNGSWISASAAADDSRVIKVAMNAAPALSNDGKTLYVAVSQGDFQGGYLVALNSATLGRIGPSGNQVRLKDPDGSDALLADNATASVTVAPNGDVFYGVLENPFPYNHDRGWLLHFSADLRQSYAPGAFGWDDTASIVPAAMVPSYRGSSSYLLMTKYNNYVEAGGDGVNRLAIVDPTATMTDPISGQTVMNEVLTIAGPTPDEEFIASFPAAVREWCINTAAVDPQTGSILVNNEDGRLYRWNLSSNTLTEAITLTAGLGEAYTPTIIGVDGTVYAINNATLFAVRQLVVNQPPSFVAGADQQATDEDGPRTIANWATAITAGPAAEASQSLSFQIAVDQPQLFTVQPAIDAAGNLTFTPAPNVAGIARISVVLKDSGGTANGGVDTSAPQSFAIRVVKAHPWHNAKNALDVSNDGYVAPNDALYIINFINQSKPQPVPQNAGTEAPYYDVDANGAVSANDALRVIDHINGDDLGTAAPGAEGEQSLAPTRGIAHGPLAMTDLLTLLSFDVASQRKRSG